MPRAGGISAPPPPPARAAAANDEADDWIPDAGEGSALIQLDQMPIHNTSGRSDNQDTNPAIVRPYPPPADDPTVVSAVSAKKSREMSSEIAASSIFGNSTQSPLFSEESAPFDLAGLEHVETHLAAHRAPAAAFDDNESLFPEDSSAELSALMKLDGEESISDINLENSDVDLLSRLSAATTGGPAIPRPSFPSPSSSTVPPMGHSSLPGTPSSVPGSGSIPPIAPSRSSIPTPMSSALGATPSGLPSPRNSMQPGPISQNPLSSGGMNQIGAAPVTIPPVGPGSLPDAPMDTSKLGGVDELLYSEPPAAYDSADGGEGGLSNKKVIIASAAAFIITLIIAISIMLSTDDEKIVEVVDASEAETNKPAQSADKAKGLEKTNDVPKMPSSDKTDTVKEAIKVEAIAKNCLPLTRYSKKFPWKRYFEKLTEQQNTTKICELLGTPPQLISNALSHMTMVGPTGYDWIVDGGRIEVYPKGTVGARDPSIEFLYTGDRLFKIKMKLRDLKIGRNADADALQEMFKKADETTDHLGRKIIHFDEQDMRVSLIEEDWYGQTLRTIEFSSVKLNAELEGHIQKLEKLEKAYKAADVAYFAWKFEDALKRYEEVNTMSPNLGAAKVKRALIHLRMDDFGDARSLAESVLETSTEDDVKGEARSILAVNALRNGNREEALKLLYDAKKLAPANGQISSYIEQLESGKYAMNTIAQTAARLACIESGKSTASEIGVLARGFFPDKQTWQKNLKGVQKEDEFKDAKNNLMAWECK